MSKYRIHLLTVLVALTAMMQVVILYRQPRPPDVPPPVADAPKDFQIDLVDFPVTGSADAKVVILEFSDYQCPFCARHATTVLPELKERYIDPGLVRYAMANNPLDIHPDAKPLAHLAMCAGEQGKYWEAHDRLFSSERPDSKSAVSVLAAEHTLDRSQLDRCLQEDGKTRGIFERDRDLVRRLGFTGTPSFAVGRIERGNRLRVERVITGAVGVKVFTEVLDEMLEAVSEQRAGF